MAAVGGRKLTFLRGSGFLLSLVGVWDLMPDASGPWPAQKGFLIFKETKLTAVIERSATMRRGVEGTYAVEGNRLLITGFFIDTAPGQGAPCDGEFTLEGDVLTMTWLSTRQVDRFRRRGPVDDGALLPPVEIYESGGPQATAR